MSNTNAVNKKGFFQNDRRLVCSMLVFYGICFLGLMGALFWGWNRQEQIASANATGTAGVIATQLAQAASTAITRSTEQAQYEFIERFDAVSARWYVGEANELYGNAGFAITNGVYEWDVRSSAGLPLWVDYFKVGSIDDFDLYTDVKFVDVESYGSVCAGFVFRKSQNAIRYNHGYVYTICDDSQFNVKFYENEEWRYVTNSSSNELIRETGWNRIGVEARGDHFLFTINNVVVFEMTDALFPQGNLALYVEVWKGMSSLVWFDNFGFQSH